MFRCLSILLCALALTTPGARAESGDFDDWSAVIIAGDWTDSRGRPIQAFDNALRDLTAAFEQAGFDPELTAAYSLRPDGGVSVRTAIEGATTVARRGSGGCLVYFTSHGAPGEIVFGPGGQLEPGPMNALIGSWCGHRPTVVVVSACYSGSFMGALSRPNRMVITAARADRASFGCSEDSDYPYFDGCVIQSLDAATDFIALAGETQRCVAERERAEGLTPPSEPQVFIGATMQLLMPTLRFQRSPD
ncbi:C13 family peptidase [Brevundimonas sp.]|uniref:C13 family peptidase n=1 Tax=Brevundimonas sp. TaxID=1871086 RepID=UPI003918FF13